MSDMTAIVVRALDVADEPQWRALFRGYRDFYRLPADEDVVSRVWTWLVDTLHECQALVAVSGDEIVPSAITGSSPAHPPARSVSGWMTSSLRRALEAGVLDERYSIVSPRLPAHRGALWCAGSQRRTTTKRRSATTRSQPGPTGLPTTLYRFPNTLGLYPVNRL